MSRPEFKVTAAMRYSVSVAAGAGLSQHEIASGLGISRQTLAKHFEHELTTGAYQRRQEVLDAMHSKAKEGNASAGKTYLAMTAAVAYEPPAAKQVKIGKKLQRAADAVTAQEGTDWADILPSNPVQ